MQLILPLEDVQHVAETINVEIESVYDFLDDPRNVAEGVRDEIVRTLTVLQILPHAPEPRIMRKKGKSS